MKTLRTYGNLAEAGFAKSLLEAAGISSELADENAYTAGYGRVVGDLRLQVEEEDLEKATHVLEEGLDATTFHAGQAAPPEETDLSAGAQRTPRFPAGVFVACAVALVALLFAVAQWRERQKDASPDEQVLKYDTNNDGKTDTVYTYRGRNLSRITIDRNNDGKPDQWEEYDSRGIIVSSSEDNDFNGVPDVYATYRNSLIEHAEVKPNGATIPARVQKYVHGILREELVDTDQDGHPDYRIEYDPFGSPSEHLPIEPAK